MRAALFPVFLSLTGALLVSACARAEQPLQVAQLIVKFRPAAVACDEKGIASFAKKTGLALQWVRPMSGEACVLRVSAPEPARSLAALQARPEVEWAESDAIMRPNPR